jgi:hypothetical protein
MLTIVGELAMMGVAVVDVVGGGCRKTALDGSANMPEDGAGFASAGWNETPVRQGEETHYTLA